MGALWRYLGDHFGGLGGSGGPFGEVWGPFGKVLGSLGGISGALSPKSPSRIPKDGPKSRLRRSQMEENGTGAPLFGVSGGPKMTPKQKQDKEHNKSTKSLKTSTGSMKINDFIS